MASNIIGRCASGTSMERNTIFLACLVPMPFFARWSIGSRLRSESWEGSSLRREYLSMLAAHWDREGWRAG